MASTAFPSTPFSRIDYPFPLFHRHLGTVSLASSSVFLSSKIHLTKFKIQRRFTRPHRFKSNGIVGFSSLDDQTDEKTFSTPETILSDNNNAELKVQTRTWNWRDYSIRYQCSGKTGPALVLVHGFGANSDHWRKNIPVLAKSHRVYAIDLIGYGYSDKPNPRQLRDDSFYSFETWATQLNEFCVDVIRDEAFFICNSIGGVVGLQAAVTEPQICKGIVLLNISLRMLHIKKQP